MTHSYDLPPPWTKLSLALPHPEPTKAFQTLTEYGHFKKEKFCQLSPQEDFANTTKLDLFDCLHFF